MEARTDNIDALYALLAARIAEETTDHWLQALDAADVPNARMATLEDIFESPYLHETGFFRPMTHPTVGQTLQVWPPIAFHGTPANIHRPQPTLGADSRDVLAEAGLDAAAIDAALGGNAP